jgi:hypothetical protein
LCHFAFILASHHFFCNKTEAKLLEGISKRIVKNIIDNFDIGNKTLTCKKILIESSKREMFQAF